MSVLESRFHPGGSFEHVERPVTSIEVRGGSSTFRRLPMSHLSIEVGHFYMKDLERGPDVIRAQFKRIAAWVRAAEATVVAGRNENSPRISTCFLADDYFHHETNPGEILGMVLPLAAEVGLRIDYIAREAACATTKDGIELAQLVADSLKDEPLRGTNGSRPPASEYGWLSNGERAASAETGEAMQRRDRRPALEFARKEHSIFADVELWSEDEDDRPGADGPKRLWSSPFLASIWQLMRLGLLRYFGEPVATPVPWWDADPQWPALWSDMPTVVQLTEGAAPFTAYRAVSVMPQLFLPVENAVRMIMDHVLIDPVVQAGISDMAAKEGIRLPPKRSERVTHVFVEGH